MSSQKRSKSRRRLQAFPSAFERALQLHIQGRITEAETAYRRLIAATPPNARLLHLLGRLLYQQEKRDEAIENIRKALKICPDDTQDLNDLGLLDKEAGALDEAVLSFTRLMEMDQSAATATNNPAVGMV